jgi:hypothetical protein
MLEVTANAEREDDDVENGDSGPGGFSYAFRPARCPNIVLISPVGICAAETDRPSAGRGAD